jgi:hypothetical protein
MKVPYRLVAWMLAIPLASWIAAPSAVAQEGSRRGFQLPPPTNLQVLPKDISQQDLLKTMQQYSTDLGVRCGFCHATDPQTHRPNFALDTKPEKNTARLMITMTEGINTKYLATLPGGEAKVSCYTCHRGSSMPEERPAAPPGAGPGRPGM